jgi:PEP-CTERM motif
MVGIFLLAFLQNGNTGFSVGKFISHLTIQVPEPGMMLLFGIGAGVLGLRIGRRSK